VSDTFAFRSVPVPLHRRVSPRMMKAALLGLVVVFAVGAFARWTIDSERASFARDAGHSQGFAPIVQISYADSGTGASVSGVDGISTADAAAQDVLRRTTTRARVAAGHPLDLAQAGPGELSGRIKGVVFTDGPSLSPRIVSVAATPEGWAAAAMSDSGLCFGVRLDGDGTQRFGTVLTSCTGAQAMGVAGTSW
jgi:hypothetical protein